jgi:hypothetical protein
MLLMLERKFNKFEEKVTRRKVNKIAQNLKKKKKQLGTKMN